MKRFLSLLAAVLLAVVVNAQTPVKGVDYKWAKISSSMTNVPDNFCEGVSKEDALEYMNDSWAAEMALYGNIPAQGGEFSAIRINDDWEPVEGNVTWAAAVDNGSAYYPCKIEPKEYEWVIITSDMTSLPTDFYSGVTAEQASAYMDENYSILACLIGNLPTDGGDFDAVILNYDYEYETVKMSWDSAVAKYDAEWGDGVAYPRSMVKTAITEVSNAQLHDSMKTIENGKLVIIKNGKRYNAAGQLVR